jgi:mannose-6-phosphate isomerase-like protein (cupin superfamily)
MLSGATEAPMPQTTRLDLARQNVGVLRDGAIALLASTRPPPRVDGLTLGIAVMDRPPPHAGERHLDGDELLYLVAGSATVAIERDEGEERVALAAGDACIVPRGLWHRVLFDRRVTLLYATPGPNNERRPLPA